MIDRSAVWLNLYLGFIVGSGKFIAKHVLRPWNPDNYCDGCPSLFILEIRV
jgi:hypothetical protein